MVSWRDRGVVLDSDDDSDAEQVFPTSHRQENERTSPGSLRDAHPGPFTGTRRNNAQDLHILTPSNDTLYKNTIASSERALSGDHTLPEFEPTQNSGTRDVFDIPSSPASTLADHPPQSASATATRIVEAGFRDRTYDFEERSTSPEALFHTPLSTPTHLATQNQVSASKSTRSHHSLPLPPATLPLQQDSSPLSEPPTTQSSTSFPRLAPSTPLTDPRTTAHVGQEGATSLQSNQRHLGLIQHNHNFRARNPIQLHPYEYDRQQYYQTLNGTGHKPVRIVERSFEREASLPTVPAEHSQDGSSLLGAIWPPSRSQTPVSSTGHIFSDVDSPEGDIVTGAIESNHKRRRLNDEARKEKLLSPSPDSSIVAAVGSRPHIRQKFRRKEFRFPEGFGPKRANDTPEPGVALDVNGYNESRALDPESSSHIADSRPPLDEVRSVTRSESQSDSDSGPISARRLVNNRHLAIPTRQDLSSSSSSDEQEDLPPPESSPAESVELHRVRKKIRGVLPASWLRIDQAQKKATTIDRRTRQSPQKSTLPPEQRQGNRLGPSILESSQKSRPLAKPIDVSSDDEQSVLTTLSDSNVEPAPHVHEPQGVRIDDWGGIQEQDWIDDMRPVAFRPRASKTGRKRQARLSYAAERGQLEQEKRLRAPSHRARLRDSKLTRNSAPVAKPRVPRLSIVDVLHYSEPSHVPDFLRVASRNARSKPNKGRHTPHQKLISLQTREEGLEVDLALRAWTASNMTPSGQHHSTTGERQPLAERSHNRRPASALQNSRTTIHDQTNFSKASLAQGAPVRSIGPHKVKVRQTRLAFPVDQSHDAEQDIDDEQVRPAKGKPVTPRLRATDSTRKDSKRLNSFRPGMLEELQENLDNKHRRFAFQRDLLQVERAQRLQPFTIQHSDTNPVLARFLLDDDGQAESIFQNENDPPIFQLPAQQPEKALSRPSPQRRRKRQPQQLQIETDEPHRLDMDQAILVENDQTSATSSSAKISGLLPFGAAYSIDFGISPLPVGICFHQSTFIGTGQLQSACNLLTRDFSYACGEQLVICGEQAYRLGSWSQSTSHDIMLIFHNMLDNIHRSKSDLDEDDSLKSASKTFETIVLWLSHRLSFPDENDLQPCLALLLDLQENLVNGCQPLARKKQNKKPLCLFWLYLVTFSAQLLQLARSGNLRSEFEIRSQLCFNKSVALALHVVLCTSSADLQHFHDKLQLRHAFESGIRHAIAVETIVGIVLMTKEYSSRECGFWPVVQSVLIELVPLQTSNINDFEDAWHCLFALLPLTEFDMQGVHQRHCRFESPPDTWTGVNVLLSRTFKLYESSQNSSSSNPYMRAILSRCYRLIRTWSWRNWETTVKTAFDFFALRGFQFLDNEEGTQSAQFLEELDVEREPKLNASDRSFHILLKTLAIGLSQLRGLVSEKKVLNTTWRFIPNHGRSHKKEDELHHKDLDAIRNQHDLLCVLYYAAPPAARPKLQLIRSLADFKTSHLEICRLNIRAWANLTRFQLSCDEPLDRIDMLVNWFDDMLRQLTLLYNHARTEAESFFQNNLSLNVSDIVESIVRSNQRQAEALLSSVLNSMSNVLKTAKNDNAAGELYRRITLERIFEMYIPGKNGLASLMCEALDVYHAFCSRSKCQELLGAAQEANEESQDYGEFPDLNDIEGEHFPVALEDEKAEDAVVSFLSNCLGSDQMSDEQLLKRLVAVYAEVSWQHVKSGRRDWTYYLEDHGSGSWSRFPNTALTSKFLAYFIACILNCDPLAFRANSFDILVVWIRSLVQRDNLLGYQHYLTSSMLNAWSQCGLIQNLPFSCKPNHANKTPRYAITYTEFRERRLSVISTVLENMYKQWDLHRGDSGSTELSQTELGQLLRALQSTMKRVYEDTQSGSSTRDTYTAFVQHIVTFLQQYTADIVAVDTFFTEGSNAFPLPSNDPTYLVGKLKAYAPKLAHSSKARKQLAAFVLSAFSRAAIDNQGQYLVDQLIQAMAGQFESSRAGNITLRRLLVQTILPPYLEMACETDCGWIVVQPIFEVLAATFKSMLSCSDIATVESALPILDIVMPIIAALVRLLVRHLTPSASSPMALPPSHLERSCSFIAGTFRVATAALATLSFTCRLASVQGRPDVATSISDAIAIILSLASKIRSQIESNPDNPFLHPLEAVSGSKDLLVQWTCASNEHSDLAQYADRILRETLQKEWSCHAVYEPGSSSPRPRYMAMQGRAQREVIPPKPLFGAESVDTETGVRTMRELNWKPGLVLLVLDEFEYAVDSFFFGGLQHRHMEQAADAVAEVFV